MNCLEFLAISDSIAMNSSEYLYVLLLGVYLVDLLGCLHVSLEFW